VATSSTTLLVDRLVTTGSLAVSQNDTRGEREGVVLADRTPLLAHEREPVHVRVDRQADVGAPLAYEPLEVAQVLRHRLGRARESPVGGEADRDHVAAEPLQQRRDHRPARPVAAVERDPEPARADPRTSMNGSASTCSMWRAIASPSTSTAPSSSQLRGAVPLDQRAHRGPLGPRSERARSAR
jgi:hypothetical protein